MADHERREAIIRARLSGLGFDLERQQGHYVVKDRRAAFDLPSALQPTVCDTLGEVITLFNLR